jgi:hypothetical protein
MNVSRNDVIVGYPVAQVRDLLRITSDGAGVARVVRLLKIEERDVRTLLNRLTDDGYLELCYVRELPHWQNTIKGNALAQAKFINPISRERADCIVNAFLERVASINGDPYYFIGVSKVEVFGSYLSEAKLVNDIDLVIHYEWKGNPSGDERTRLSQMRYQEAKKKGRTFRNIAEDITWPTKEVTLFIRAKEPRLSLHTPDDGILNVVQKKVLYEGPATLFTARQARPEP